jgi:anti-sigma B factor antagonist
MTNLTATAHATSSGVVLELAGELDHTSAPLVHEALAALDLSPGDQLVLDLGGLTFCDSSGISAFLAARNRALAADAGFAVSAVPARIGRVFEIVGLDRVLTIHPTAQDAAEAWTASSRP